MTFGTLSLRTRLLAGLAVVAAVLVLISWAITATTCSRLIDEIDNELEATTELARPGHVAEHHGDGAAETSEQLAPHDHEERLSDFFEGTLHPGQRIEVFFSPNLPGHDYGPPDLTWEAAAGRTTDPFTVAAIDGGTRYRAVAVAVGDDYFVRALPLATVDKTIQQLLLLELLGLTLVLTVLGAVAWWVIRLGIRPIGVMTETAVRIAEGDLSARVPPSATGATEAGMLAVALNTMLGRIESAVKERERSEGRLRRFVADASHELRTPITTIRGYAELYRVGGLSRGDDLDDAMRRTGDEAHRMGRLVEDMLTLAKLDQERALTTVPVDVSHVLRDIVNDAAVTAPDHRVRSDLSDGLLVAGDPDRIRQVFANLVANAAAHTPVGTDIDLTARRDDRELDGVIRECIVVVVSDDGPGMSIDTIAQATERFYRADPSRTRDSGGSGLGLSIVESVVASHGGSLTLASTPGEGTTVTVVLPATT